MWPRAWHRPEARRRTECSGSGPCCSATIWCRVGPATYAVATQGFRVGVGVQHGCRPLPADLPGEGGLLGEPEPKVRCCREFGADGLHSHRPATRGAGQVDHAHAAFAQSPEEPVTRDAVRVLSLQRLHRCRLPPR
jgi:hypothetical protein